MNSRAILFITLFLATLVGWSQNYNVRIDGQIIDYDGKSEMTYTLSSVNISHNYFTVKPDSLGRFTILKTINGTKFFRLIYLGRNNGLIRYECKLVVQPNKNYSFISRGQKQEDWGIHSSPDIYSWEKANDNSNTFYNMDFGQMYFNKIDNSTMGSLYQKDWNLFKPETLIDTLQSRIKAMENVFINLLKEGKINQEFYEISKLNIEYVNAYRLIQTISDTWQMEQYKINDSTVVEKLIKIYPKIFELYPVKGIKMEQVCDFDKYVDKYLVFLADSKDGTFKPQRRKGSSYSKVLENSGEVLSPEANKNYTMRNTMSNVASLDLGSAKVAKDFLNKNPDMRNTPAGQFLEDALIPRAEDFAKSTDDSIPQGAFILDEDKPVKSFQALLDKLQGKPFLIDFWGTWCGPCREQFRYNNRLKPFLKENVIEMVYIAYEYEPSREKWKNFIKAFNLTGYHFISNDAFKSDFEKYAGKIAGFPTYIIVDSRGKILESKAYFPSDGEKLFIQMKEKLKD